MAAIYENHQNVYENVGKSGKTGKPRIAEKPKPKSGQKFIVGIDIGQSTMGYAIAPADKPREISHLRNWAASYGYTAMKCPSMVFASQQKTEIGFTGYETFCNNYGSEYEGDDMALAKGLARLSKKTEKEAKRVALLNKTLEKLFEVAVDAVRDTYRVKVEKADVKLVVVVPQQQKGSKKETFHKETQKLIEKWNPENKTMGKLDAALTYCTLNTSGKPGPGRILVINAGASDIQLGYYEGSAPNKSTETKSYVLKAHDSTGFGASRINKYFVEFISDTLNGRFVKTCKEESPVAWLELMNSFEQSKKGASPGSRAPYNLQLSSSFGESFEAFHKTTIAEHLKDNQHFTVTKDWKLRLSATLMKTFYDNVITEIEKKIMDMVHILTCKPSRIFLVGGFSDSEYMHNTVRKLFPEVKIIKPENSDVCALKGSIFAEEMSIEIKK